jgi:hypothetical protein
MKLLYIGIDNGVSGAISVLNSSGQVLDCINTPIEKRLSYTKKAQYLNTVKIFALLSYFKDIQDLGRIISCYIERPMINPMRFKASLSAIMAYFSFVIVLEHLKIPYSTIDSKLWQKNTLPKGKDLKEMSLQVAKRKFPTVEKLNSGKADSLLIADFARRSK